MKFIELKSRGGNYLVVADNVAWLRDYENGQTQIGMVGGAPLLIVAGVIVFATSGVTAVALWREVERGQELLVREGDRVAAGQTVAEFDTAQLRAQLAERTATHESAKAQLATDPVLQALHASGELRGDPGLARLMLFGALNWSVQWYDPARQASLDDLTQTTLQLFLKDPV